MLDVLHILLRCFSGVFGPLLRSHLKRACSTYDDTTVLYGQAGPCIKPNIRAKTEGKGALYLNNILRQNEKCSVLDLVGDACVLPPFFHPSYRESAM